jgi:hypothetical protein
VTRQPSVPPDRTLAPPPAAKATSTASGGQSTLERPSRLDWWWHGSLGILLATYVGLYGWLLARTDFLPYTFDAAETFSAHWHAYNLYHFDFFASLGLTDEAFSPDPAAHPFVHSHQGNVPRLFTLLIYVLGARTPESQIAATAFTAGLLAMILPFVFLARRAGPRFALLACLVFLTDYLFFAQWHLVTYRVWHAFFVFSSLLCVDGLGGPRRRRWAVLTFLNFLCLFYYELIFVAFVTLFSALYAAWQYRWRVRTALTFWRLQLAGGGLALLILLVQGTLVLGPRVFAEDLYLTFVARNSAADDPAMLERIDAFYRTHPIVFWFNFTDVRGLRSLDAVVGQLAKWHFEVLTPYLTLVLGIVVVGWLLGHIPWRRPNVRAATRAGGSTWLLDDRWLTPLGTIRLSLRWYGPVRLPHWAAQLRDDRVRASLTLLLLGGPALLLALALIRDQASFLRQTRGLGYLWLAGGAAATLLLTWAALPSWRVLARLPLGRVALAGTFLLASSGVVRAQSGLYNQDAAPLWHGYLGLGLPHVALALIVGAACALAAVLVLLGSRRVLGCEPHRHLGPIASYIVLGALAFYGTYQLSPGYVISGYLSRTAPLAVFLVDVALAAGLYVLAQAGWRAAHGAAGLVRDIMQPTWQRSVAAAALGGASLLLLISVTIMIASWAKVQTSYLALLPPTHFAFLKMLADPPYVGQSFVGNRYMAGPAAYTGQWAYIDATIGQARIELTDDGYRVAQELQTYLWLRDRATNPAYREPRYYLCVRYQALPDAVARAQGYESRAGACNDLPIVRRADSNDQLYLHYRVVGRDPSPFSSWVIVELDWDFPPFLTRLADGSQVQVTLQPTANGPALDVAYTYAHQQGVAEAHTRVRLYGLEADGGRCLLGERQGGGLLALPLDAAGPFVVGVQPGTSSKFGPEYLSEPVNVGTGSAGRQPCP